MTKLLTKNVRHTFVRGGYFYFSRRVPSDLQHHYRYPRIVQGLRTRSEMKARGQATVAAAQLEAYWAKLRLVDEQIIGTKLLKHELHDRKQGATVEPIPSSSVTLSDALNLYVNLKGKDRGKGFRIAAERTCSYVIKVCGNKDLSHFNRHDALAFRDWLVDRGLTGSSVTRNFSYLKAIINFARSELALEINNPFVGVYHDRSKGVVTRQPIPVKDIRVVQQQCEKHDDDLRWLIALISDSGMRLAEAAGLLKSDFVNLQGDVPYISLRKHSWRPLKTKSSERSVPLVGKSLWAAQRIVQSNPNNEFAFPRYNTKGLTKANSASAALNKWMKPYVLISCTIHSFRHSMRDRLRAVECPSDIVDQIGGWQSEGIGQSYGSGYPIEVLHNWMKKACE